MSPDWINLGSEFRSYLYTNTALEDFIHEYLIKITFVLKRFITLLIYIVSHVGITSIRPLKISVLPLNYEIQDKFLFRKPYRKLHMNRPTPNTQMLFNRACNLAVMYRYKNKFVHQLHTENAFVLTFSRTLWFDHHYSAKTVYKNTRFSCILYWNNIDS